MDTFAIGTLINGQFKVDSKEKAEACYKILNDETRRLEYILSAYDPDSDVTRLNQHPGEWIQIEPETFEVLNGSKTIAALTHGTFDPTVGALVKLWSVDQPEHRVPSEAEIKRALINVDYNLIDAKRKTADISARSVRSSPSLSAPSARAISLTRSLINSSKADAETLW